MAELTFGRVPHPAFQDRPITKAAGAGQDNLGKRSVKGVVWHRMIGTLAGTDTYFRFPTVKALTDYGVGVDGPDADALDGVIYRWNDPLGYQSGWASGSYSAAAYGDGLAFVAKNGVNAINRDQASIEISGNYDTPLTEKARQAIVNLTAYWADQYQIPWDVFPISPIDGFSFVRWHQEFGPENGTKVCPGSVVMSETSALIERVRAVLKAYQVAQDVKPIPPAPTYATPELPEWWPESLENARPSDARVDGAVWRAIRRREEAVANANRYSRPDTSSPKSGPKILVREKIGIERWFIGADKKQWFVEDAGHFVPANAFTPAVSIKSR